MPSVTITFSAAVATRIQDALKESLPLYDRDATIEDLKSYIRTDIKQLVRTSERRVSRRAAEASSTDIDIT